MQIFQTEICISLLLFLKKLKSYREANYLSSNFLSTSSTTVVDLDTGKVLKGKHDFTASSPLIRLSTLLSLYYHVSFSDPPTPNLKH